MKDLYQAWLASLFTRICPAVPTESQRVLEEAIRNNGRGGWGGGAMLSILPAPAGPPAVLVSH